MFVASEGALMFTAAVTFFSPFKAFAASAMNFPVCCYVDILFLELCPLDVFLSDEFFFNAKHKFLIPVIANYCMQRFSVLS
jgi:hypothetical protein